MARPLKNGLDYFSFDVDFFNDEKIEFVSARFGIKGEIIAIRLLCKIYRNGYYIEWNEDENILLAKRAGDNITPTLVREVVNELVRRRFFDESLLNSFSILTSKGIQKRYLSSTIERKTIEINPDFWLIEMPKNASFLVSRPINEVSRPINEVSRPKSTQSKVKESKLKEEVKEETPTTTPSEMLERIQSNMRRPIDDIFSEMDKNELWKENMCMIYRIKGNTREIKIQNFDKILEMFYRHLTVELQEKEKSMRDTYSHFSNWIKKINLNAI